MTRPQRGGASQLWWLPAAAVGVAAMALGWARYVEPRRLEISTWEVPIEGLAPEAETTLLHLSDLHVGSLAFTAQELLGALGSDALSSPLVCITGDFCDRPDEVPRVEALLASLLHAMAVHGGRAVRAYAVWGNHDCKVGLRSLGDVMGRLGIMMLNNAAVEVGHGLWLAGVADPTTHQDRLAEALSAVPQGAPHVLLAHNPSIFPRAAQAGVPLTLAGHTHGGQIRIGGIDRFAVQGGAARPYRSGGWYRRGEQAMFVSRGVGTTFIPVRLGARPEATVIRLKAGEVAAPAQG